MHSRLLQRVLIALAIACLLPLGILAFSFSPPLSTYLMRHGVLSLIIVRVGCGLAVSAVLALVLARRRIEALLEAADRHVRRVVAAEGLVSPSLEAPVHHTLVVTVAALVALVAVGLALTTPAGYKAFIWEDGPIEYGSATCWFAAALCGLVGLWVDRRNLQVKALMYLPAIGFFVMCGGEEISWGQRVWHFETPAAIQALNKQHEFNLHDIGSIAVYENIFFVVALIVCLVVPLVLERAPAWQSYLRHRFNAPVVDPIVARAFGIGLAAWLIVGIRYGTLGSSPLSLWGYYSQLDDELFEFFAAYGFFALAALDVTHRLAATGRGPRRTPAPVPSTISY